jgi:hypothetical protein
MSNDTQNADIAKKKRQQINYTELLLISWFVLSCTLGPNLISQFIAPPIARTLFTIVSIAILILLLVGKLKPRQRGDNAPTNKIANTIIVAGFGIYTLSLLIAGVTSTTANLGDAFGRILLFATFAIANACMTESIFSKCMDRYCQIMTAFSVAAIIVTLGVLILTIPPTNEFIAEGGRVYQNYIIAFVEAEVDTMKDFKRAGSFYDEPGTFAMFLTPAIFWTMLIRPSKFTFFSLILADLLSFSIGGWMAFGSALVYVVKVCPDLIKKYQFVIISTFVVTGIIVCFNLLLQLTDVSWLADYYNYKFEGSGSPDQVSSANIRQNEIETFFNTISENPLGYGTKSPRIPIFSVGFFASSIEGGLLGAIGYFICFMGMLLNLFQHFFISSRYARSRYTVPILGAVLSLIIMSFQRIDMLSFYSGIFMLSFMVNCPLPQKQPMLAGIPQNSPDIEPEVVKEEMVKPKSAPEWQSRWEPEPESEPESESVVESEPEASDEPSKIFIFGQERPTYKSRKDL